MRPSDNVKEISTTRRTRYAEVPAAHNSDWQLPARSEAGEAVIDNLTTDNGLDLLIPLNTIQDQNLLRIAAHGPDRSSFPWRN